MFAMGVSGYAIYQLTTTGMNLIWLGVILINLPIMLFISRVMIFKDMARTSAHFPLLTLVAVIGIALAVFEFLQLSNANAKINKVDQLALALASAGFIFYFLYNFWYSSLNRSEHPLLQTGKQLPVFSVTDTNGKQIDSESFKGNPTILIFFRGNWCPLCMAQIKEIAAEYKKLARFGAKVALISPQPEKNTQVLAAKFDVPFDFLTDISNRAATSLGVAMVNGLPSGMEMFGYDKDTVYPTVIITDAKGKIIYTDFTNNYRIRPEPEAFISILEADMIKG